MTDHHLADATVVVHPLLTPISDSDIEAALTPARIGAGTRVVRLGGRPLKLTDLSDLDWGAAHDDMVREVDARLMPALEGCSGPIHYLGILPIPLAVEVGCRLGPARRIVSYQQRHDSKSWRWPAAGPVVKAQLTGVPTSSCNAKGDVIVRVTCSHRADSDDARTVVPHALGELHVEVETPHEDVLQCDDDVTLVASKFGEALDAVRRCYPNCDTIHVFAAVPPALAVRMGAEINPTIHRPVQTYQFSDRGTPRYTRAILVGERPTPSLSAEARRSAAETRSVFARALVELGAPGDAPSDTDRWLTDLIGPEAEQLPRPVWDLGPLGTNRAIFGASVSDVPEAGGEFRWDTETRAWIFDDRLLSALGARLRGSDLAQAARLFLLHEAVHIARQGITSATADRIGRLPRVLEEADYVADVWALLHEYARARRAGDTDQARAADYFRRMLRIATATFWAFDAADLPLRAVQVRRLNRYLLWYWQRLTLEHADSLVDVVRVLATKPVLEISGPRLSAAHGRVMFDLDPAYATAVEFGALVDGFRVVRVGSRPGACVGDLLAALRLGDEPAFISALRGVFDSVR